MPLGPNRKNRVAKTIPVCGTNGGPSNGFTSKQNVAPKVSYKVNYPQNTDLPGHSGKMK